MMQGRQVPHWEKRKEKRKVIW